MKIEEKFNKRTAELVNVQSPIIRYGSHHSALGIKAQFIPLPGNDTRTLSMHMTPDEALALAAQLIEAARKVTQ